MSRRAVWLVLVMGSLLPGSLGFAAAPPIGSDEGEAFSITVAVGKYWNGAEGKNLQRLAKGHPFVIASWATSAEDGIGVPTAQIERAAVAAVPDGMIYVVRTAKPFEQRKTVEKLIPKATATETKQGNTWTNDKTQCVVCLADGRTLIVAPPASARRLAQAPIVAWADEKLSALGDPTSSKTLLAFRLSPSVVGGFTKADDSRLEPFRPLGDARSLGMKIEVDQGLQVTFSAEFADEKAAKLGQPALEKVLETLGKYFELAKTKMPEVLRAQHREYPGAKEVAEDLIRAIQAAQAGLRDTKVVRNGNKVEATIAIKTDQPVSTAVLLLSLMPREAKKKS
jgi:hypothetical protein